ncbi:MAG: cobalt ECF transporter T component CbiQ [Candidatus Heteroscillospira sp.]|jgi:cobalt/nickel transport system permease protein
MGTDRYAYLSRLRGTDPIPKLILSLSALLVCLMCESIAVGLFTLLCMSALSVLLGGQRPGVVLRFLRLPVAFLLIGCVTIVFRPVQEGESALWSVCFFSRWVWGVTGEWLFQGAMVFCKAMGTIAAMYFLSLNTPMTDIVMALERLRVPRLFTELMELIYRFIFILAETASRIRTAQESRLGYTGFRRSVESLGLLSSVVFLRAWRRGDRVWSALESRGYTGSLKTMPQLYESGSRLYIAAAVTVLAQLAVLFAERSFIV